MKLYDTSLEQCVIGALCIGPDSMKKVVRFLKPEDFTILACEMLYQKMYDEFIHNHPIDVNILPSCISSIMSEPTEYVRECMMLAPTTNNVVLHAHVIHEAARERRLQTSVYEIFNTEEEDVLATTIIQKCQDFLKDGRGEATGMFQLMNEACDKLSEPMGLRIDTGFPRLDGILKGLWGGNLILIGARPSCGKSCFGLDLAEHAARQGHTTMLYSLEMLSDELTERMICRRANIPLDHIIDRVMSDDEILRYTQACADLSSLPIIVNDTPNITVQQIRADTKIQQNVELIIIDYIGLLRAEGKYPNRNLELGAISRELKNLAAELKIPIVAMAQLNRQKDSGDEPNLSDLRDSGELEQNANKVIFLWNVDEEQGIKGCKVAKNRRGKNGTVHMRFQGEYMKFTELSENINVKSKKSDDMWNDDEY